MGFGFISKNASDEIVIDDNSQIIGLVREGTLSSSSQTGVSGSWNFDLGTAKPLGLEFIAFELNIGQWVCLNELEYIGSYNIKNISSNLKNIQYKVFSPASVISSPSGYGMAVYDSLGNVCWHDKIVSASCDKSLIQDGSTMTTRNFEYFFFSSSNCVCLTTGSFTLNFTSADVWSSVLERVSTNDWRIRPQQIASSGSSTTTVDTVFERTISANLLYV